MVKKLILAVYDVKSEHYSHFPYNGGANEDTAKRDFQAAVNNPDSVLADNPHDYCLCKIGEYNMITGLIVPEKKPKVLMTAYEAMITRPEENETTEKEINSNG